MIQCSASSRIKVSIKLFRWSLEKIKGSTGVSPCPLYAVPLYPHPLSQRPYNHQATYTRFRMDILVIGARPNFGETMHFQRVCNATEDPCILRHE